MRRKLLSALTVSLFLCLASSATALPANAAPAGPPAAGVGADTVWVIVAAVFVMFMQAGFAMLEVGFSRMKNVGTVVAKVITNFSISSIVYWAVGCGFAFGGGVLFWLIGGSGWFPSFSPGSQMDLPALVGSTAPASAKFFFEF